MKDILFVVFCAFLFLDACQPIDEKIVENPPTFLRFSSDTVSFDTVFTRLKTTTRRLTITNPDKNAIILTKIELFKGKESVFSLIINGRRENQAENIRLLGNDSLLILIETLLPETGKDEPQKIEDELLVRFGEKEQRVKLLLWAQDAFFYDSPQKRHIISRDTTWSARKPIVILDTLLLVSKGCMLTVEKGARIHFGNESALYIGGTLHATGTPQQPIYFQSLRLDRDYAFTPAQWKAIFFLEGSQNNLLEWAVVRNANVGLRIGTPDNDILPDVTVRYSIIKNMSVAGIQAFNSDVVLENTLIFGCGQQTVALVLGGNYTLTHNTIVAFNLLHRTRNCTPFARNTPSFLLSNFLNVSGQTLSAPFSLTMTNNLLWGDLEEEVSKQIRAGIDFSIVARNNLIRTKDANFQGNGNILNTNPRFAGKRCEDNFTLMRESPAVNAGTLTSLQLDLTGKLRDSKPDIGAFEF
ncbi:MAG: right-handed parallel beta-helix repeat-containing protein [Flammeovirgaceae bacterium]|nr:right-handed parallel beta-helix repeat-containing protein [Flammeovirgaceae bacterium]MDW8286663.1 right-handed parallel beta-helix repeat-containing protein [Flammeovirgaceae bacterium]